MASPCSLASYFWQTGQKNVIDPEIVLEHAELAVGAAMVAQRRAAGLDGLVEHRLDRVNQPFRPVVRCSGPGRDRRGAALR
jgi:hypothetical protein